MSDVNKTAPAETKTTTFPAQMNITTGIKAKPARVINSSARNIVSHFNGHFPGGPLLAGNRMSPFWILLQLRMMEVVVEL